MLEITILSIIQGITEFLPISSSAHLILVSEYLNINNENLILDVSLHFGSLLAVIFFFRKEILNFVKNKFLFLKIILGSFPTIISGYLLVKFGLIDQLRDTKIIAFSTIIFGILLFISDKSKEKKNIEENLTMINILYIGFMQTLSLIPGVSRSGITISAARFLKFDRVEAAKISFLYSIPTLIVICSYNLSKIIELKSLHLTIQNSWGVIFSFIFSLITLKIFTKFLKKFSLTFFMVYRIIFGFFILIYA